MEVKGDKDTRDYHRGNPPWSEQKRAIPLRTFSGNVVYKRKKHVWRMRDITRVTLAAELFEENPPDGWLKELLWKIREVTLSLLERIIPVLGKEEIVQLYDFVYEFLSKIFGVDPDWIKATPSSGEQLIYLIAAKYGLEVTIKRIK